MTFEVTVDVREIDRYAEGLVELERKELPFALANSLTDLSGDGRDAVVESMDTRFDRPTPFTKRGVGIRSATKRNLEAEIFVKRLQAGYLHRQETGGVNRPKRRALIEPGHVKLNRFGNIPRRKVSRLLKRKDTFSGEVRFKATGERIAGVWQRPKRGRRRGGGKGTIGRTSAIRKSAGKRTGLKLLVRYRDRREVKPRFRFRETIERRVGERIFSVLDRNLEQAVRTSMRRSAGPS